MSTCHQHSLMGCQKQPDPGNMDTQRSHDLRVCVTLYSYILNSNITGCVLRRLHLLFGFEDVKRCCQTSTHPLRLQPIKLEHNSTYTRVTHDLRRGASGPGAAQHPHQARGVLQIQLPCAGRRLENQETRETPGAWWQRRRSFAQVRHAIPKNLPPRLQQMQEDRQSLWTETAAAAASWFQAPLGILAASRHIMTVGHQLYAAQWKRGGTVPESFADWWRGDRGGWEKCQGKGGGGTFENKTQ